MSAVSAYAVLPIAVDDPTMGEPGAVSEQEVDSICGMLMQLECVVCDRMGFHSDCDDQGKWSSLKITPEEKVEAARKSALNAIVLSERGAQEKEMAIKRLLDTGEGGDASANVRDGRGRTPLMLAVVEANTTIVEVLLKCDKVDLLTRDLSGNTVLMYACVRGYDSIVRLFMKEFKRKFRKDSATLLDYLDAENDEGDTAFTLALKNGHEDCVIVLSEYLKEALEKEERRVTSLAYRMGLRGKSESRMPSTVSLKDDPIMKGDPSERTPTRHSADEVLEERRRSGSWKASASSSRMTALKGLGRRGRDVSKYYPSEVRALLDSEAGTSTGSPEIRRSSPVSAAKVGLDVDAHCHGRHRSKSISSKEKNQMYHKHCSRCKKHKSEDKKALCGEGEESDD